MDWSSEVDSIKVTMPSGKADRSAALVLLWSISQARFEEPRLMRWSAVRDELTELFARYGSPSSTDPFAGLADSPWWEVSGTAEGGLPEEVYGAVAKDADQRNQAVDALTGRFFTGTVVVLLAELGLSPSWDGYGPVPGVKVGDWFPKRVDAYRAKVHRQLQAGICGTAKNGCESIAIVGGYEDDIDNGDVIVYTGEGGRDAKTGKQVAHQRLTKGNAALVTSKMERKPVRVLRGSTSAGYTYGGLYLVENYWQATGKSGFRIWQYEMVAIDSVPSTEPLTPQGVVQPGRRGSHAERLMRSAIIAHWVKEINNFTCQFCGNRYDSPVGPYAETAHIKPLGGKHAGPDIVENALCLCPTHHKLFDLGAFIIDDDRYVVDVMAGLRMGPLNEVGAHRIDIQFAAYHRELRPI
ncbi:YDG/SRA domain-containing protein [Kutzneria sp. NPDC051319]|uniref:YDG/SRA domain-containing protein n=1 Tax=Kutzneria sp. NPDC051319 TaxID=3155047 RepID=UPI003421A49C